MSDIYINDVSFEPNSTSQKEFFEATEDEVLFGGSAGGGKGQPLSALISTPKGFVKLGSLKVGDVISNPSGGTQTIRQIHELGIKDIWVVIFNDGTCADFTDEHLWSVKKIERNRTLLPPAFKRPSLVETKEIVKEFRGGTRSKAQTKYRYIIPTVYPTELEVNPIPQFINPYIFGVLMSKSFNLYKSVGGARTTMADVEKLKSTIISNKASLPKWFWKDDISCKEITKTSTETRFQFVRGLLDADVLDKHIGIHTISFATKYKKAVVENLMYVLRSLGYVVKYRYTAPKKIYQITIGGKQIDRLFTREMIKRRISECIMLGGEPVLYEKEIVNIHYRGKKECRCITVSDPKGLYITKDFIVTHNSLALVIDPMKYKDYQDYTAIIFRRSFPELEPLINYGRKYYNAAGADYHVQSKTFTFPSGATVKYGFMDAEGDWDNYQGHQYAGMYMDELTNILWSNVKAIRPWNRSKAMGIPPYFRAATNPGGPSHTEVKQYFVDTCPPIRDGELIFSEEAQMYWQPMKAGPTYYDVNPIDGSLKTRKYIPSRVFQNVDLLRTNPGYVSELLRLDPHKRKAYLEGDWDIFEGQFFNMSRDVHELLPDDEDFDYSGYRIIAGLDYGNRTVLEVCRMDERGYVDCFAEKYIDHIVPSRSAELVAEELISRRLFNIKLRYDTNMDADTSKYTGYDKTPLAIFREVLKKKMGKRMPTLIPVSKSSPDKRNFRQFANEAVKEYLDYEKNPDGSFKTLPRLRISRDCIELWNTMPKLIHDPNKNAGLDFNRKIGISDPYDGLKYGFLGLYIPIKNPEVRVLTEHEKIMEYVASKQKKSQINGGVRKSFINY